MTADAQNPEIDPIASQTAEKAEFEQGTQQGDEAIGPGEEIVEVEDSVDEGDYVCWPNHAR